MLRRLIGRVDPTASSGDFRRKVAVVAMGTLAGQGIVVLASPILTRLYDPAAFGVLGAYMSLVVVLAVGSSLRYDLAITLPPDEETAADLLALALCLVLAVSALVGLVLAGFGEQIAAFLRVPELAPYLWLLPLGLAGAGVYQALSAWSVRSRDYGTLARTRLSQGIGQVAVQLALGVAGAGSAGLLAGDVVGRAAGSGSLAISGFRGIRISLQGVSVRRLRDTAHRYRHFPKYSSWSGVLNSLGLQLPTLLFVVLYGPIVAGWLALGQRVVGMPSRIVGQAMSQVYLGEASRLMRDDRARLPGLMDRLTRRLALGGALPIACIGMAGPVAFPVLFGGEWREAGWYVLFLAPTMWAQFVVSPISQTTALAERQRVQLAADALRIVAVVIGIVVPFIFEAPARVAVMTYAVSMMLSYGGYLHMYRRVIREACSPSTITHPSTYSPASR